MGHHQSPHPPLVTEAAQVLSGIEWVTYDTVARMPRSQVGLRISQEALTRIDTLANEYDTTRAAAVRALLSEALASQPVVDATRRRLAGAL
jgi:hypothetical protein